MTAVLYGENADPARVDSLRRLLRLAMTGPQVQRLVTEIETYALEPASARDPDTGARAPCAGRSIRSA